MSSHEIFWHKLKLLIAVSSEVARKDLSKVGKYPPTHTHKVGSGWDGGFLVVHEKGAREAQPESNILISLLWACCDLQLF